MVDWDRYWAEQPKAFGETDFLRQVGRTIGGLPYSPSQFEAVVRGLASLLELGPEDSLLDLCCGNGVLTAPLARVCARGVGVDFSEPLIAVARRHNQPDNVIYHQLDVRRLDLLPEHDRAPFNRVLLYGSLQHFAPSDLQPMLEGIVRVTEADRRVVIGAIPDKGRRRHFLDTTGKRVRSAYYRLRRRDLMGTWWDPRTISETCMRLGLKSEIVTADLSPDQLTAHYRFDVVIWGP